MSTGLLVPFRTAASIAKELHYQLEPLVERVMVAGSLRRRMERVTDIEIVVEPFSGSTDLFGDRAEPELEAVTALVQTWGDVEANGDRYKRIRLEAHRLHLKLDLFLVHPPAQWGSILAIRTGPRELSQEAVTRLRTRRMRHVGGHVERMGAGAAEVVPTPDEETFFELCGLPCLDPPDRERWRELVPRREVLQ